MKPDSVLSAVNKLLSDPKVGIVLTGYCSNSNFEVKNMAEAGMPYIIAGYPAQTAEIISPNPDKFPTVWSYSCSFRGYETELPKVVEGWAKEGKLTLKGKKVALIASDNPYSMTIYKGLKETFTEMGWTITLDEKVPFAEVLDWRVILGKIHGNNQTSSSIPTTCRETGRPLCSSSWRTRRSPSSSYSMARPFPSSSS